MSSDEQIKNHTLALLVDNRAGVLARVTDLIARRSYNIVSLAVAPTNDDSYSRITIVVDVESTILEQIVKQLFKLINVIEIAELSSEDAVSRELMMVTISLGDKTLVELERVIAESAGTVVIQEQTDTSLTLSAGASSSELDTLEQALAAFGIVDAQRTGQIALPRLGRSVPIMRAR